MTYTAPPTWEQVVDVSGASFSGFTGASGTWSSDGSVIKQTDTAATDRRARYDTLIDVSHIIYESEVQLKSSGTDRIGGILVGFGGTTTGGLLLRLNQTGTLQGSIDGQVASVSQAATVNIDTWYKLRVVAGGGVAAAYLDGTLKFSFANPDAGADDVTYIGLYTYQAEVWFRNLKAWNLAMPV